jgi:hypothetical protein
MLEVTVMWTSTVVVLELAGVGLVFWYLFFHHAKPYEIKGDPWGVYGDGSEDVENHADFSRSETFICTSIDDPSDLFCGDSMEGEFDFAA